MRKDEELSQQLKVMMGKAKDSLEVAKQLHKQNHYNDAASKAYYAVFHSLQAASLTKGLSFSKHSAVMSAFNKEFIYGGVFAKNFYDKIVRLFHDRQIGDYEYEKYINHESSEADVGDAEAIICAIGEYLQKEGYLDVWPFFARTEQDHFLLDMRTVYDDTVVDMIAVALGKIASQS